jgi:hypothetical protein
MNIKMYGDPAVIVRAPVVYQEHVITPDGIETKGKTVIVDQSQYTMPDYQPTEKPTPYLTYAALAIGAYLMFK